MADRKGICRLCGEYKPLTPEHIPPKKAFNENFVMVETLQDALRGYRPTKFRQGMNARSLCQSCNNNTGVWYAEALIDWCKQGFNWYSKLGDKGLFYLPYQIKPLNVLKQVLVMAIAMLPESTLKSHTELRRFLLNREQKYLMPKYEVYVYFNVDGSPRFASEGVVTRVDVNRMSYVLAEVALPPFGYCICERVQNYRSLAEYQGLCNINWFSEFDYNIWTEVQLRLPALETHEPFALDYRAKSEVEEHYRANSLSRNKRT